MQIDFTDTDPKMRKAFIMTMESILVFRELELTKNEWVSWAQEMWASMEINNVEDLKMALNVMMYKDLSEILGESESLIKTMKENFT